MCAKSRDRNLFSSGLGSKGPRLQSRPLTGKVVREPLQVKPLGKLHVEHGSEALDDDVCDDASGARNSRRRHCARGKLHLGNGFCKEPSEKEGPRRERDGHEQSWEEVPQDELHKPFESKKIPGNKLPLSTALIVVQEKSPSMVVDLVKTTPLDPLVTWCLAMVVCARSLTRPRTLSPAPRALL